MTVDQNDAQAAAALSEQEAPEQTDNRTRAEDGVQDVDQDPSVDYSAPTT